MVDRRHPLAEDLEHRAHGGASCRLGAAAAQLELTHRERKQLDSHCRRKQREQVGEATRRRRRVAARGGQPAGREADLEEILHHEYRGREQPRRQPQPPHQPKAADEDEQQVEGAQKVLRVDGSDEDGHGHAQRRQPIEPPEGAHLQRAWRRVDGNRAACAQGAWRRAAHRGSARALLGGGDDGERSGDGEAYIEGTWLGDGSTPVGLLVEAEIVEDVGAKCAGAVRRRGAITHRAESKSSLPPPPLAPPAAARSAAAAARVTQEGHSSDARRAARGATRASPGLPAQSEEEAPLLAEWHMMSTGRASRPILWPHAQARGQSRCAGPSPQQLAASRAPRRHGGTWPTSTRPPARPAGARAPTARPSRPSPRRPAASGRLAAHADRAARPRSRCDPGRCQHHRRRRRWADSRRGKRPVQVR
eukprot:scaffold50924_cov69-Phaeocystis_antarctica.AAC.7